MRRLLVWLGLVSLAAYLVFVGGAWSGLYSAGIRLTSEILAAAVIGTWAFVAWRRPDWRPRSVLLPVIAGCLASMALSTAFSISPRISVDYLAYGFVLAAMYLLLVRLMAEPFFRQRFVSLAVIVFVAVTVAYGALVLADWTTWLAVVGHFDIPPLRPEFESLTFGSPQGVLVIVALLAVPIVGSLDWTTRRGVLTVAATVVVVGLVGLVSGSRGAWIALAAATVFAIALILSTNRGGNIRWFRSTLATRPHRAVAGITLVAIVAASVALGPRILDRIGAGGEANRIGFVVDAVRLFEEHPVTGGGLGTWVIERPRLTQAGEVDDYQPHAHDLYAQTLGELGLGGVVAGLILVASLAWLVLGGIRGRDPIRRRWAIATSVGAVYFLTHQLVDFWADMPALLFAAAIPVAYLDATATTSMSLRRRTMPTALGAKALGAGALAIAFGLTWLGIDDVQAIRYEALVARANAGDWAAAEPDLGQIAASDPAISVYVFTAGLAADRLGDRATAIADFARVALQADLPEAWLNLAAEQVAVGDSAGAQASLEHAYRLGVQRAGVALPIGSLALGLGDTTLARSAFAAAIANAPSLAADPWWAAEPARHAAFEDATALLVGEGSWETALMTGDATLATSVAMSVGARPEARLFIRGWSGDATATDALVADCRASPSDVTLQLWCARIEHRAGNEAGASAFEQLANAQGREAFLGGLELRVVTGQGLGIQQGGGLATAWGLYTYRRPTPQDMLVPSLVHLEYR